MEREEDRMEEKEKPILLYMHIPKTAGTTMYTILLNQYRAEELLTFYYQWDDYVRAASQLPDMIRGSHSQVKCIFGHFFFGLHAYIPKPAIYATMLREPVEQVLSLYYYIRRVPEHPLHSQVVQMSLEDYLTNNKTYFASWNPQASQLANPFLPDLDKAITHLDTFYAFVGITEMFNESLFLMNRLFDWKQSSYQYWNVTEKRPQQQNIPPELIQLIREKTKLDGGLYHYAKLRLEQKLAALTPEEMKELQIFKEQLENRKKT